MSRLAEFADGNRVSGELLELSHTGGVFRTDRFGEITFAPAPVWVPVSWGLAGSVMWREENGDQQYEVDTDLHAEWQGERDDASARLRSKLREKNDEVDSNEQSARIRWFHGFRDPWMIMTQTYVERDTVDGTFIRDADYLLLQGTLGAGLQHAWSSRAFGRIALAVNRFRLELLDYDLHEYSSANSIFTELRFGLTERLLFNSWVNVYAWETDETGLESESEIEYALNRNLALGLRHRFRENGATLESRELNEFRIFTRLTF